MALSSEAIEKAKVMMKLYDIKGEITTYATGDYCSIGLGRKGPRKRAWMAWGYPKVIWYKNHENLLAGMKRLIMRRNPVE